MFFIVPGFGYLIHDISENTQKLGFGNGHAFCSKRSLNINTTWGSATKWSECKWADKWVTATYITNCQSTDFIGTAFWTRWGGTIWLLIHDRHSGGQQSKLFRRLKPDGYIRKLTCVLFLLGNASPSRGSILNNAVPWANSSYTKIRFPPGWSQWYIVM